MKRLFQLAFAATILAPIALGSLASFQFDSFGGALSGTPGSTVGWGFTISDPSEYVVLDQTDFCPSGLTNVSDFPCASGPGGTYTDFSSNAPIIGPSPYSTSVTENFDDTLQTGYGSFSINAGAAVGSVISGEVYIIYDLYSGDPAAGGSTISQNNLTMLDASVTVVGSSVPEPGTMLPFGIGVASLLALRRTFVGHDRSRGK